MKTHRQLATLACLSLLFVANAWAAAPDGLEAHAAWVREAPPNARVLAAYLQLHNHGDKMVTLVSVESDQFERAELHRSAEKGGMASMAGVSQVMIPKHGKVAFKPGGLHIMLIKPSHALHVGDIVDLTLTFSDGRSLGITAEVRRDADNGKHTAPHGDKAHQHAVPAAMPHNHDHGH